MAVWESIAGRNLDLYFAYTARSFWQAYNDANSKPFRDTNHEPEIFLRARWPRSWMPDEAPNVHWQLGINHQSNGRALPLSRSWNRLIAGVDFPLGPVSTEFRAWWRFPEDPKEGPDDPEGDDNPDIEKYVGRTELSLRWATDTLEYGLRWRSNWDFSKPRGSVLASLWFPINDRLQGYAEVFSGYGESLIDYNRSAERISVGIALNRWP